MIELGRRSYLLFDGDCGVCSSCAEIARRMDRQGRFEVAPYQSISESELNRFGLDYGRCNAKVRMITASGKVRSGAFALNAFLWGRFPWTVLVALIYAVPLLLLIEVALYALVARNRHLISRWLGLKACLVRPDSSDVSR